VRWDVYYRDGSVVITEAGKKHSVITAHGKIATKGKIEPVDAADFAGDHNFVEINTKAPSNEVIFPSRQRWRHRTGHDEESGDGDDGTLADQVE
jgi:hypothetical protein